MNNEEPSTDYGLSSEIDIIFSEVRENKKQKNVGETSQATSLQFASQIKDDKSKAHETSNEEDKYTRNVDGVDDKLITWAARLELESISLKEFVTGNLGHIFKQNYDFLKVACEEMTTKLDRIECQVDELKKSRDEYKIVEKLGTAIDDLNEKVVNIEKMVQPMSESTREKRNNRGTLDVIVAEKVDQSLLNNKLMKTTMKNSEKVAHGLEKLERYLDAATSENRERCVALGTKMSDVFEDHDKRILNKLSSLQNSFTEHGHETNLDFMQEIVSIKQYLKLLLPRIIGLETNSKQLYRDYHELLTLINGTIKPEPIQCDNNKPPNNTPVSIDHQNMIKHLQDDESVPESVELNQKKRKLV